MKRKNLFSKLVLIVLTLGFVAGVFNPIVVQTIATWYAKGYVYSTAGGTISGAKVRLYGYSTGSVTPDLSAAPGSSTPKDLKPDGSVLGTSVRGTWILLKTVYTSSSGYYYVSTSYYSDKTQMKIVVSKSGYLSTSYIFDSNAGYHYRTFTMIKIPPKPTGLAWRSSNPIEVNYVNWKAELYWRVDGTPYQGYLEVNDGTKTFQTIKLTSSQMINKHMSYYIPDTYTYLKFRLKMRNYDSKYKVYSAFTYSSWLSITLPTRPAAPQGLQWAGDGVVDIAYNTDPIFIGWCVDNDPSEAYLEVSDGNNIIQTIQLTQDDIKNHYTIYTPASSGDYLEFRIKMRNRVWDSGLKKYIYSSFSLTSWKGDFFVSDNTFFPIGGYPIAYFDSWDHSSREDVKADLSVIVSAQEVVSGYLDVSVAAFFLSSGKNCLLGDGLRIRLVNRGGIERTDTLTGPGDRWMEAINYEGEVLTPDGDDPFLINVHPTQVIRAMGTALSLCRIYYSVAYGAGSVSLVESALGMLTSGMTIWGGITLAMSIAKYFWFDLPNSDQEHAVGTGAHVQTTYGTSGSFALTTKPVELVAFAKFRVKAINSIYNMNFDVMVDTVTNLRDGYTGYYWSGSYLQTLAQIRL